jgi:hypothetical protein
MYGLVMPVQFLLTFIGLSTRSANEGLRLEGRDGDGERRRASVHKARHMEEFCLPGLRVVRGRQQDRACHFVA